MCRIESSDMKPLDIEDVEKLLSDALHSRQAILPIVVANIECFLQTHPTLRVSKATGTASGVNRGMQAARQALEKLTNVDPPRWLVIDVNVHADDKNALVEYGAAVAHLLLVTGNKIKILGGLRTDYELVNTVEVAIVTEENTCM